MFQFLLLQFFFFIQVSFVNIAPQFLYPPPQNEVAVVYSDPYVRLFVRSFVRSSVSPSVRPSQSLIRYSSKTAEQNFMKLSGTVHYLMPYCTSYFKFLCARFWGFPEQNKDFAITTYGLSLIHI